MDLEWIKCVGNQWCQLNRLDLTHRNIKGLDGVYILWHGKDERVILKVGSGKIAQLLVENVDDIAVQAFEKYVLYVTWTSAPLLKRKGIEAFLFNTLSPKIKEEAPKAKPITVNLPW